jgi:RHS repeat-associated protein
MSTTSGTDPQVLSLPNGGGAVQDMGASFETDLNTGTGSYGLDITVPCGPNGLQPQLKLRYHTGAGNGTFGMGWTMGALAIARQTDMGLPTYAPGADRFTLLGVDDLIDMGDGTFRPRVDNNFFRIRRSGAGWEITDTRGSVNILGTTPASQVSDGARVGQWLLESTSDPGEGSIFYTYQADGAQRYIRNITWGTYRLDFIYEPRPDRFLSGFYGFLVQTNLRCARLELNVVGQDPSLVRSWNFTYTLAPNSGLTLLSTITLRGHAADGSTLDAPSVTLGYSNAPQPTLQRVQGPWPGSSPPPFASGKVETVDWDGDGLPDIFELSNGIARVWPNRGNGRFDFPNPLKNFPGPLNLNDPGVAFADLDGNGVVDLFQAISVNARYTPISPGGGYGRTVTFDQAPSARLASGTARLVDLNGDGIVDVLETGTDFFALYYRTPNGWSIEPQVVPVTSAPPVSFQDAHTRLGDMTGDGLQDLVRVDGAGARYWPYLGNGLWAGEIQLQNSPALPFNFDPERLFLYDVDGDGCADFIYLDTGSVTVWFNQGGQSISDPLVLNYMPAAAPADVRLCDFNGAGTAGILYSNVPNGPSARGYFYLDLCGGVKPYLLTTIDNGLGMRTSITYSSSTQYAIEAAAGGNPWTTFHPFPVQVVASIQTQDLVTGESSNVTHNYHECRYDPGLKTFLGFRVVESVTAGDASVPAQRLVNTYHLGVDPADPNRPLDQQETLLYGAVRRRLLSTEIYGLDGSPGQDKPYKVTTHSYTAQLVTGANGNQIAIAFESQTVDENQERTGASIFTKTIDYLTHDAYGNITSQRLRIGRPGATPDQDVTTTTTFAQNLPAYLMSFPAEIMQKDSAGNILSSKIITYDGPDFVGLAVGQVSVGFNTRVEVLVLPDTLVTQVYGAAPPDFSTLGYHRRTDQTGWFAASVSYARVTGPPFTLTSRNARGFDAQVEYDSTRQFSIKLTDALNQVTTGTPDVRAFTIGALIDANGNTTIDNFDALCRVTSNVGQMDTPALPTTAWEYSTAAAPLSTTTRIRLNHGLPATSDQVQYFDGRGRVICTIVPGGAAAGGAFIQSGQCSYNARGSVATGYGPFIVPDQKLHTPPPGTPQTTFTYDGLGRIIEQVDQSGARRSIQSAADVSTLTDDVVGGTISRVLTQFCDSLGRVTAVQRTLAGRAVRSTYTYDSLGNLLTVHDPDGGVSTFAYDLLGRRILQNTVDTGQIIFVIDANGNQAERRSASGATLTYTIDELDRLVTTHASTPGSSDTRYTYLKPGDPAPADGTHNRIGRLWKIDDALGTLIHAYDAHGRTIQTRRTVTRLGRDFVTDFVLDAAGRQLSTTLPEPTPGAGRTTVSYSYDPRGVPVSAAGFVKSASYDLNGRLFDWTLQNNVRTQVAFVPNTNRLGRVQITGGDGVTVLRDSTYSYDDPGNVLNIASPIPAEAGSFTYDDFDRLITAGYGNGDTFAYAYSDAGTPTSIAGLGVCATRTTGSGQIVTAGPDTYTYDSDGHLQTAPYGTLAYDAADRLMSIAFTDGSSEKYEYDHTGMRCYKLAFDSTESYVITPSLEIVNGTPIVWVTFGSRRIACIVAKATTFSHYDLTGSPNLFTDAAGGQARRLAFGPYGTVRSDSAATPPPEGTRYAGAITDEKSGLICMGLRFYDPRLGRFISADILATTFALDGWNPYLYARCNPLRYVDVSGASIWDVLAIIAVCIVIAALIVAAVFTGGLTLTIIPGLVVGVQGLLVATAIGVAGGAVIGGIAAYQAHGSIAEGVLFGGFVGGVSAFAGAYLSAGVFGLMGGSTLTGSAAVGANAAAGAIQGAIAGAGTGAAVGFAGGKGSAGDVFKHMLMGFVTGAVTGALLGVFFGGFDPTNKDGIGGQIRVGTYLKYVPPAPDATVMQQVNFLDNALSTTQDAANWLSNGTSAAPNGITEFIFTDANGPQTLSTVFDVSANKALITIPMGWAPSVFVPYGGCIFLNDASMVLDQTGTVTWDQQFMTLLNAAPIVGYILGYGLLGSTQGEQDFNNWVKQTFSQQLSS